MSDYSQFRDADGRHCVPIGGAGCYLGRLGDDVSLFMNGREVSRWDLSGKEVVKHFLPNVQIEVGLDEAGAVQATAFEIDNQALPDPFKKLHIQYVPVTDGQGTVIDGEFRVRLGKLNHIVLRISVSAGNNALVLDSDGVLWVGGREVATQLPS